MKTIKNFFLLIFFSTIFLTSCKEDSPTSDANTNSKSEVPNNYYVPVNAGNSWTYGSSLNSVDSKKVCTQEGTKIIEGQKFDRISNAAILLGGIATDSLKIRKDKNVYIANYDFESVNPSTSKLNVTYNFLDVGASINDIFSTQTYTQINTELPINQVGFTGTYKAIIKYTFESKILDRNSLTISGKTYLDVIRVQKTVYLELSLELNGTYTKDGKTIPITKVPVEVGKKQVVGTEIIRYANNHGILTVNTDFDYSKYIITDTFEQGTFKYVVDANIILAIRGRMNSLNKKFIANLEDFKLTK
jgi:hypothetical protein